MQLRSSVRDAKSDHLPRTDSRYLPESQKEDIPDILRALILSGFQNVSGLVAGADPHRAPGYSNDAKVTAHHAIIPTPPEQTSVPASEIEFNLYDAIRRFYIAQFYSEFEFTKTSIEVQCGRHLFAASGKTPPNKAGRFCLLLIVKAVPRTRGRHRRAG